MSIEDKLLGAPAGGGITPSENFNTVIYDGNGSANPITDVGFQPDFVWIKQRDVAVEQSNLYDSTRGIRNFIVSNSSAANVYGSANRLNAFDSGGFTLGSDNEINDSSSAYVAWCWKANGGTTSTNEEGSEDSTVQANDDAGFSIVKYTGTGSNLTIGHGLSAAPDLVIVKNLDSTTSWLVQHSSIGPTKALYLETTGAEADNATFWNDTAPTTTTVSIGTHSDGNASGDDIIAYCFRDVAGFSKFGSYTGNESSNGPIVETGFEVGYLMIKESSDTSYWSIWDNKRNTTNPRTKFLKANSTDAEATDTASYSVDFLSNGFQIKGDGSNINKETHTYISMAYATYPDTEVPTLADSFGIKTWTGDAADDRGITGLGFKPNMVWFKTRNQSNDHNLSDSIRGATKQVRPNRDIAEQSATDLIKSFDTDGFTLGTGGDANASSDTYVAWAWKGNDDVPTAHFPTQTVDDIKSTNLMLDINLAGGSYSGSGSVIEDLSSAEEDFTVTNATVKEGYGGYYIDFDGSGDYADSDSSIATTTGNDITIEFWVRSESGSQPSYADIMDANHGTAVAGSSGQGWAIQMRAANQNSFYFVYYDGSGYQSNSDSEIFELTTDKWTHIAIVKSGTSVQVYEDGVAGNSWTASDATIANPNQIIRLAGWLAGGRDFNGSLGQVRIYSDALSAGEVLGNYNATKGLFTVTESTVSANANAGFSIVQFKTPASPGAYTRVPHGLSAAPDFIVVKRTDGTEDWYVYHTSMGLSKAVRLNSDIAEASSTDLFNTVNATVFNPTFTGTGNMECIAYCFHSVTGYSSFGGYTGTGSAQTITTGFAPDYVITKNTTSVDNWRQYDSVRENTQPFDEILYPNLSDGEDDNTTGITGTTASGFVLGTGNLSNDSGEEYIYIAFKIN